MGTVVRCPTCESVILRVARTPTQLWLRAWLDICLDEVVGRMDGPAALTAWSAFDRQDWEALYALDEEIMAMRASSAARRSIRATGLRLIATWSVLYPYWASDACSIRLAWNVLALPCQLHSAVYVRQPA
jgi:urease accessory protein UreF